MSTSATISVRELIDALTGYIEENPTHADYKVVMARDPEGNGFCFVQAEGLVSIGLANGIWGSPELEDVDVLAIWPGYPQLESVWNPNEEEA